MAMHGSRAMTDASGRLRGSRRLAIAGGLLWLVAACSTGAGAPSAAPASVAPPASASAAAVATASAPATASPVASSPDASAAASIPVLDPERCPATLPPADATTPEGIAIEGDAEFITQVQDGLALLRDKAPEAYAGVVERVTRIRSVPNFSGMCYDTGTYRVGEETAYAPGYPKAQQVVWLAGTIVHDGCHRARFVAGEVPGGRDGELDCLQQQLAALKLIDAGGRFHDYVDDLVKGVDDPKNQYWNDPNRHW
jgi:hypothetical protein